MNADEPRRITIIGLGLLGGSLGLAIKAAGLDNIEVVGYDRDRGVAHRARKLGAIDRAQLDLRKAVEGTALVIIATPILAIREVMEGIAPHLPDNCVVTDTASTKAVVLQWARELLPPTVSFVGGHPLAGKETQGIDNADAKLFADKAYVVVPSVQASEAAVNALLSIVHLIGAHPLFLDAAEHDQYTAAVSHLPILLSTALFTLARSSPGWPDLAPVASSAFRDLTRLASGDPEMSHDICLTNRDAILHWLDRLLAELYRYRDLLQTDSDELFKAFAQAQADRNQFIAQGPPVRAPREGPDVRGELLTSLVGQALVGRLRKASDIARILREREAEGQPKQSRAHRLRSHR